MRPAPRLLSPVLFLAAMGIWAHPSLAQTHTTNVTVSSLVVGNSTETGSVAMPYGTVCASAVSLQGTAISISESGWGMLPARTQICGQVVSGAISGGINLPDSYHSYSAAPFCYNFIVTQTDASGDPIATPVALNNVCGVTGPTWALDAYAPPSSVPTPSAVVGYGGSVPSTCTSPSIWDNGTSLYHCVAGSYALYGGSGASSGSSGAMQVSNGVGGFSAGTPAAPATVVATVNELVNGQSANDCPYGGLSYPVYNGGCRWTEVVAGPWNFNQTVQQAGDVNDLVAYGSANGWTGPVLGPGEAEYKNYGGRANAIVKADSGLMSSGGTTCNIYGAGDSYCGGYNYASVRAGVAFASDEGSGAEDWWFGETGPPSGTMTLSGSTLTPAGESCPWGLPATSACNPAAFTRVVDTASGDVHAGRFTGTVSAASISGCSFVNWIWAIPTSAALPATSVYGCTATPNVLVSNVTVSGTTVTYSSGQPLQSSWAGLSVALWDGAHATYTTISSCSTTCTLAANGGPVSGTATMAIRTTSDVQVAQTLTFTGGAGLFAVNDPVCVVGDHGSGDAIQSAFVEQSRVTSISGSAGAQTVGLTLALPNSQVIVFKGGCGWMELDADTYIDNFSPGYIYIGSLDGSTALTTSEAYSAVGAFYFPAGNEPALAVANPAFATSTAYSSGTYFFDSTAHCGGAGCVWKVTAGGTSGGSTPSFGDYSNSAVVTVTTGGVTATNIGPATLFKADPVAARVVRNNFNSQTGAGGVKTFAYANSTIEPESGMASGDSFINPNYDAQQFNGRKLQMQCLTPATANAFNCIDEVLLAQGPGFEGAGNALLNLVNNNPLSMYYSGGSLGGVQLMPPPNAFNVNIGGSAQPGVFNDIFNLNYAPLSSIVEIHNHYPGQTASYLLGQDDWSGNIKLTNGGIDFEGFTSFTSAGSPICTQANAATYCPPGGTISGLTTGNVVYAASPTTIASTTNFMVVPGSGTTPTIMDFEQTYATPAICFYDGSFPTTKCTASSYGVGIQSNELQSFVPAGDHFSFNGGGVLNSSGTNEWARISAAGFTLGSGEGIVGQAAAPSGSCSTSGVFVISQDGHGTLCASGTWTAKF